MKYKVILIVMYLGLVSGVAMAVSGTEYAITNAPGDQLYAYIYENRIVWMDDRVTDDYYDIRVYDLGPDGIFGTADDGGGRIVVGTSMDEYYPDIYEDLVPYAAGYGAYSAPGRLTADENVYLFNLKTNKTSPLAVAPKYQCCPQVFNTTVVWHDKREDGVTYNVYVYDLGPDAEYGTDDDGGEFQITNISGVNQNAPQIWGRNVVWRDSRNDAGDIYLYDAGADGRFNTADDRGEFRVTTTGKQGYTEVRDRLIAWTDWRNWGSVADIYIYDMGPDGAYGTADDRGEFRVTDENAHQMDPRVYGKIIVWMDKRNGNFDVYMYDMGPDELFNTADDVGERALVTNPFDQKRISIYGSKIVYDDDRNGNKDIYLYDLAKKQGIADIIQDFGYTSKQFYVAPPELFGAIGALDSFPVSSEQKSVIAPIMYRPIKNLGGKIYATAAEQVLERYRVKDGYKKVPMAIVARGDLGVDALASVAYARALQIPILLTDPDEIPGATKDVLDKLDPDSVILIGGPVAVSRAVEKQLSVSRRIAGKDRYETAALLADVLIATRDVDTVVVTDGLKPAPEAVMLAAKYGAPILYTSGDKLPSETKAVLKKYRDKFTRVETVGVSPEAEILVNAAG